MRPPTVVRPGGRYRPAVPVPSIVPGQGRRFRVLAMAAGPVSFITSWAIGGARTLGYSPVTDAISGIAAVGAPERMLMTGGFVAYGALALVGASGLVGTVIERIRPALVVNAVSTLAVALLPLERSTGGDTAHAVAAGIGYVSLAAIPALAAGPLARSGRRRAAAASVAIATVVGLSLAATVVLDQSGLAQRVGLTTGDAWLITAAIAVASGHLTQPPSADM